MISGVNVGVPRIGFHGSIAPALAGVLVLASPGQAQAQEAAAPPDQPVDASPQTAADQRLVYTPADFAQYAPRSALDMLQQIPGFNI